MNPGSPDRRRFCSRGNRAPRHLLRSIGPALLAVGVASAAQRADPPTSSMRPDVEIESGAIGARPPGWIVPTPGWTARLDDADALEGARAVVVERDAFADEASAGVGNLMRFVPGGPYRGRLVRLRAAIRVEPTGPDDRVQMWMRVDRESGRAGFFEDMSDRPARDRAWTHHAIDAPVAEDAARIRFGFLVFGSPRVIIDDVSLEVVGEIPASARPEPPRAMSDRELRNLVAFARLAGAVRFFHPSDGVEAADWDRLVVHGVRSIASAPDGESLRRRLRAFLSPVAPTVRITGAERPPSVSARPEGATHVRIVRHAGVGLASSGRSIYRTWYETRPLEADEPPGDGPDPRVPLRLELADDVLAWMPPSTWSDGRSSLPSAAIEAEEIADGALPVGIDDRAVRLAAVVQCWTVFQHFYPYFDVVDADWDAELERALRASAIAADDDAALDAVRTMVAALEDGHGSVFHDGARRLARPAFGCAFAEGRVVVTTVAEDAGGPSGLSRGDVIRSIDGVAAVDLLAEEERTISGSSQWRRHRALQRLGRGLPGTIARVVVERRDGRVEDVDLPRAPPTIDLAEARPEQGSEIADGVVYVDIDRLGEGDLAGLLPTLIAARGIVVDFRAYPRASDVVRLLGHLATEPMTSATWNVPAPTRPNRENMTFRSSRWPVQPLEPRITAPTAFLIDASAISAAETMTGFVEAYDLAALVGSPTAGANGNINPFELPGGFTVSWTGMQVLKQDGSQLHLIGILPTVPVERTIDGIAAGRDELLDAAIQVVLDAVEDGRAGGR